MKTGTRNRIKKNSPSHNNGDVPEDCWCSESRFGISELEKTQSYFGRYTRATAPNPPDEHIISNTISTIDI